MTNAHSSSPVCVGNGLVALDVIINSQDSNHAQFLAGGSCGNVMTILSFLGWQSYPIARLSNNVAGDLLYQDLLRWKVNDDLLDMSNDGSTPIIIHRILKDKKGETKHRFEFKNPEDGKYLPSYKPCLAKSVPTILERVAKTNVFFFDRINRASIDLARAYSANGAIVYFEPSSIKDEKGFEASCRIADVVKFSEDRIPDFDNIYPVAIAPLEIQTLGSNGLKYRRKGQSTWIFLRGYAIDNLTDAAGAGDWSTAGIITNLFKIPQVKIADISDESLHFAIQYGQALSALNCTFEGARGLMYNVNRQELNLMISHIVSSSKTTISSGSRAKQQVRQLDLDVKISSLFAKINR